VGLSILTLLIAEAAIPVVRLHKEEKNIHDMELKIYEGN
jgi:hypothetical protein